MDCQREDKAIAQFTLAINDGFQDAYSYGMRGYCQHALGFLEKAIPDYEKALAYDSKDRTSLVGLSDIALRRDQPLKALQYCDRILEGDNRAALMCKYGNKGQALSMLGKLQESVKAYELAFNVWESDCSGDVDLAADVGTRLADLLDQLGERTKSEAVRYRVRVALDKLVSGSERLKDELRSKFPHKLTTKHLVIYSQDKWSDSKRTGLFIEQFLDFIDGNFVRIRDDFSLNVFIFKDLFSYRSVKTQLLRGDPRSEGCYNLQVSGILIYNDCGYGTVAHEVMHAVVWSTLLYIDPWAFEGIPCFFERMYSYEQPSAPTVRVGFQNAQRMNSLWKKLPGLSLKHYAYDCLKSPIQNENANRLIAMFVQHHNKLVPYLRMAKEGRRGRYMTVLEAVFDLPIEKLEPLWQQYLEEVAKRRTLIEKTPISRFFSSKEEYNRFLQENADVLEASW